MNWQDVLQARETDTHFVIEGRRAVEAAQAAGWELSHCFEIGQDLTREEASELLGFHFLRRHLGIAQKRPNPPLDTFDQRPLVVLPKIADPGNLGTIIRNTAALGGGGLLLGQGASPYNAKAVRAAAGANFTLPIRRSPDLLADLDALASSRELLGTCLDHGAHPLPPRPDLSHPAALLLGPEDDGLSAEFRDRCHQLLVLPMSSGMDSLNVASASAIFLHWLQQDL